MARARLYGWNGERPAKPVTGQAQIVLFGLSAQPEALYTGKEWAEIIGPDLRTRQDPYRVVLYYILRLKAAGCIRTRELDITAETRKEDVKHGITVVTDSTIEERHREDPSQDVVNELQAAFDAGRA